MKQGEYVNGMVYAMAYIFDGPDRDEECRIHYEEKLNRNLSIACSKEETTLEVRVYISEKRMKIRGSLGCPEAEIK